MRVTFTKMQGIGNDFVVLDARQQPMELNREQVRQLADRHFGVGCDQVLLLQPPQGKADVRYRIFNADGNEVEQCGNGARAVARYLAVHDLAGQSSISAETGAGPIMLHLESADQVRVNMGVPQFDPREIPLALDQPAEQYRVVLGDQQIDFSALSMGNPHAVLLVVDVDHAAVEEIGTALQQHALFPQSVNVGFMQVLDRAHIRLRVYERGVGETLACGTGACAAVVAGICLRRLDSEVTVALPGGCLDIRWDGDGQPVWMTGPAEFVFTGQIEL